MTRVRRTRAESVAVNDVAIRSVVASTVCDQGWGGVTFTGVATRAGLTVGVVKV